MKTLKLLPIILVVLFACKNKDSDPVPVPTATTDIMSSIAMGSIAWKMDGIQNTSTGIKNASDGFAINAIAGDSNSNNSIMININFWNTDSIHYAIDDYGSYGALITWGESDVMRATHGCDSSNATFMVTNVDTITKTFSATFQGKTCFPTDTVTNNITDGIITNLRYTIY